MALDLSLLTPLLSNNGPDPEHYPALNNWFQEVGETIRKGNFPKENLPLVWEQCDPMCSEKTAAGRVCRKPHGYAGDFEIIDHIHTAWVSQDERYKKWDRYFQSQPACQAVRNRKAYFHAQLEELEDRIPNRNIQILNVGCGPCRDVLEFLETHPKTRIRFTCLDLDMNAISYGKKLCSEHSERVSFVRANVLRFTMNPVFDLVWSAGLFDYLSDRGFAALLRKLRGMTLAGGEVVVGNFSPANPSRDYMEFGHWFLNHRDEHHLCLLADRVGVPEGTLRIGQEPLGINLFLHVRGNGHVRA